MLHLEEIKKISDNIGIAPLNIVREHFEIEILNVLSKSELSEKIIFYGGTAIRLAYGGPRFSEDLDFIFDNQYKKAPKELEAILTSVSKSNPGVIVEEIYDKRNTLFGLVHISNPLLKHSIRIKIEISKKTHKQSSEYLMLSSPASILSPVIKTSNLQCLIQNKLSAIRDRNEARDWFDLWFINKKSSSIHLPETAFPFNKKEFENELKRWLSRNFWKVIPEVINFYEKN